MDSVILFWMLEARFSQRRDWYINTLAPISRIFSCTVSWDSQKFILTPRARLPRKPMPCSAIQPGNMKETHSSFSSMGFKA